MPGHGHFSVLEVRNGRLQTLVTLRDFSIAASCYPELKDRVRPEAGFGKPLMNDFYDAKPSRVFGITTLG